MSGPALRAVDISLQRGSRVIYSNLTIEFDQGLTAILGPNGIGKTTLLEGLADPSGFSGGQLEYRDATVGAGMAIEEYFGAVGFLPQKLTFYRGFNVRDAIEYSAWLKGLNGTAARKAADSVMDDLDLTPHAKTLVHKLSGGMQQRVGIAEAFVNAPNVVILDEPTVGLDPEQRNVVRRYLRSAAKSAAIIVSTHLTDDVEAVADRVVVVSGGKAIFDGTPEGLRQEGDVADAESVGSALESGYLEVVRRSQAGNAS